MNHMLWPTALLAALLFWLGGNMERTLVNRTARIVFLTLAGIAAMPGVLFALYYTKLLGEPIWLYQFRAAPYTELTAAGAGILAGFIHQLRTKVPVLKRQLRRLTVPVLFSLMLIAPYLKPLLRPLRDDQLHEQWQGDVCIQSTPSTCGPASAASILRSLGKDVTEADLAQESLTYAGGTENWYWVRALRSRGPTVRYHKLKPDESDLPVPSIAGVKLKYGTGHFIALLEKQSDQYVVGAPLTGEVSGSLPDLRRQYTFTPVR